MNHIVAIDTSRPRAASPARAPHALRELSALRELATPDAYLARHSRSFRFAAALLRGAGRDRVARVYAWCRFTDDLVDDSSTDAMRTADRLGCWLDCSRAAYEGHPSGVPLVDRVMGEMAERAIPFAYAADLAAGVQSDLYFAPFPDLDRSTATGTRCSTQVSLNAPTSRCHCALSKSIARNQQVPSGRRG